MTSHTFPRKPNDTRLKSGNDRLSPIKNAPKEAYPVKKNNFFEARPMNEGEQSGYSPKNGIKNATFKEWNTKIKDIDHSSPWRRPSGKLVKEYWNQNEPSNPYNATWTRFILKTHFDIKLEQSENQYNGPKWKIRRLKNVRIGKSKERQAGFEDGSPQDPNKQMTKKVQEPLARFKKPGSFNDYQLQDHLQQQSNYSLQPDMNLVYKPQVI